HKVPFARGGDNSPSNLRLLCGKHNRLEAERAYGKKHMERYVKETGEQYRIKRSNKRLREHGEQYSTKMMEGYVKEHRGQYRMKKPGCGFSISTTGL
ncbi:MAG: HNH endonuclease, partial [Candidatus Krumholzibacteria bacterium]|nr:HNH endonuclease [Candidatus Krumholzibacteria bacterium]